MKIPDKFPAGSEFWASFSGDEFVVLPAGGGVFKLADDGESLLSRDGLPRLESLAPISEANFLNCAASCRAFAASKAAS